jgi:peroxiredoxin
MAPLHGAGAKYFLIRLIKSGKILLMINRVKRIVPVVLLAMAFCLGLFTSAFAQAQVGEKAPLFSTTTLDGKRVALKDYWEQKGHKAIVLSFFATWCQPCKEDLKYLYALQQELGSKGFQVLTVLTQDSSSDKPEAVKKLFSDLAVDLPVLLDEYGIIGKRYAVTALPCNALIDKDGILKAKYLGYSDAVKKDFEGRMKPLLSPP